jgi:hypothetical protein
MCRPLMPLGPPTFSTLVGRRPVVSSSCLGSFQVPSPKSTMRFIAHPRGPWA